MKPKIITKDDIVQDASVEEEKLFDYITGKEIPNESFNMDCSLAALFRNQ